MKIQIVGKKIFSPGLCNQNQNIEKRLLQQRFQLLMESIIKIILTEQVLLNNY